MNRRILQVGLSLLCVGPIMAGCEDVFHNLRRNRDPDVKTSKTGDDEVETTKVLAVRSDGKEGTKPFFRSSRLSGAMSDEGREIENDLGIK